jgi:hypothetical protein
VTVPVVILVGEAQRIAEVILVDGQDAAEGRDHGNGPDAAAVAAELAARVGGKGLRRRSVGDSSALGDLRPGQVCIAPVDSWQVMAAHTPPDGAALIMVLEPPPLVPPDDRSYV